MKLKSVGLYIAVILAIIVIVNIISDKLFIRLDLTGDNRYTLSKATKNIVKDLDETVTISAYFSENLPAEVAKTKRDFKELLTEYRNLSKGNLVYEFIDPSKDEEAEKEAMQKGIQPVMINVREKDQVKQQKAFLGAVVQKGTQKEVIPFMQPGMAMEYALSSAIKKLSVTNKPVVGFLQGHGEPELNQMQQAMTELNVIYQVKPVNLTTNPNALSGITTLAIVAPVDSISSSEFSAIDAFMANGGKVYVAINRVNGKLQEQHGETHNNGLETWLKSKNINVENSFVLDATCASVGVQQQQGFFQFTSQVQFPYIPIIHKFSKNAITTGLEQVMLEFASPVTYTGDSSARFTPILMSSERSATQAPPLYFDIQKRWTQNDFPLAEIPLGGLLEGNIGGNALSKMVVIGDGDFAVNGDPRQPRKQNSDNINLMVNSIDYLSDDTGLIELRTKGVTSRPIDQIEDGKRTFIKWLNVLLPIVLIILIGIIRNQQQRNLRIKRMEEGYV